MASIVQICNIALDMVGATRITSLTQDSPNARHCNVAYEPMRDAELRAHPWSFAKTRAVLAPDTVPPAYGYDYQFTLPADCLRPLLPPTYALDWQIEGGKILTNDGDVLQLTYVKRVTDPNHMDPLFRDALSCKIALHICETITQSNTKKESIRADYKAAIREARRVNAIERVGDEPPEDSWILARL